MTKSLSFGANTFIYHLNLEIIMGVGFREFKYSDAKRCAEIIKKALDGEKFDNLKIKAKILAEHTPNELIKKSKNIHYFVLFTKARISKEVIIGIGGIKDSGEVKTAYVEPDFQGMGYGKKIMRFLEEKAKEKGISKLFLWSSPRHIEFYKKLGFILMPRHKGDTYMIKEI